MSETQAARQSGEYRPAPVTVGRAAAYFDLHCRLGFADAVDRLTKPEKKAGRSNWAEGKRSAQPERVQLDLGGFVLAVVQENALAELAEIVLDIPEGSGGEAPIAAVRAALVPFATACWQLIAELMGIERGMASA